MFLLSINKTISKTKPKVLVCSLPISATILLYVLFLRWALTVFPVWPWTGFKQSFYLSLLNRECHGHVPLSWSHHLEVTSLNPSCFIECSISILTLLPSYYFAHPVAFINVRNCHECFLLFFSYANTHHILEILWGKFPDFGCLCLFSGTVTVWR